MRSEHVLSTPFTEDWLRRCTDELAPRLTPGGDARAVVIDAPDGTTAACALGLAYPQAPGDLRRLGLLLEQPDRLYPYRFTALTPCRGQPAPIRIPHTPRDTATAPSPAGTSLRFTPTSRSQ
ncbi:hypothetical protein AB0G98_17160 [Streptomyces sp. NPDC020196]|uniref:hypothetical protein n=1 Tax=Streptomyces TaxID=1883 RepID=UPI0033282175